MPGTNLLPGPGSWSPTWVDFLAARAYALRGPQNGTSRPVLRAIACLSAGTSGPVRMGLRFRDRDRDARNVHSENCDSRRGPVGRGRCRAKGLLLGLEEHEAKALAVHRVQPVTPDEPLRR